MPHAVKGASATLGSLPRIVHLGAPSWSCYEGDVPKSVRALHGIPLDALWFPPGALVVRAITPLTTDLWVIQYALRKPWEGGLHDAHSPMRAAKGLLRPGTAILALERLATLRATAAPASKAARKQDTDARHHPTAAMPCTVGEWRAPQPTSMCQPLESQNTGGFYEYPHLPASNFRTERGAVQATANGAPTRTIAFIVHGITFLYHAERLEPQEPPPAAQKAVFSGVRPPTRR